MARKAILGFDDSLLQKVNTDQASRQKFIYSMVAFMLIGVSFLVLLSSSSFVLIVFNNWFFAISAGLFLSWVIFNLYRFMIVSSLNADRTALGVFHLNHTLQYADYIDSLHNVNNEYLEKLPDTEILKVVNQRKDQLRDNTRNTPGLSFEFSKTLLTNIVRVLFLAVLGLVFSNGFQLLIFRDDINQILDETFRVLSVENTNSWLLRNMLTPSGGDRFLLLNTNSLLLTLNLLVKGLGYWKLIFDLLFLFVFLLPLILVFKSKEIQNGCYIKELALHEITVSFTDFLFTQKRYFQILKEIKSEDLYLTLYKEKINAEKV